MPEPVERPAEQADVGAGEDLPDRADDVPRDQQRQRHDDQADSDAASRARHGQRHDDAERDLDRQHDRPRRAGCATARRRSGRRARSRVEQLVEPVEADPEELVGAEDVLHRVVDDGHQRDDRGERDQTNTGRTRNQALLVERSCPSAPLPVDAAGRRRRRGSCAGSKTSARRPRRRRRRPSAHAAPQHGWPPSAHQGDAVRPRSSTRSTGAGRPGAVGAGATNSGRTPSSMRARPAARRSCAERDRVAAPTCAPAPSTAARQDVHARRADEVADEGVRRRSNSSCGVPICTTSPSCITTTLSAKVSASVWSCVT